MFYGAIRFLTRLPIIFKVKAQNAEIGGSPMKSADVARDDASPLEGEGQFVNNQVVIADPV